MDDYTRSRFIIAIDKFNKKEFFECHEVLEDIWFDTRDNSRDFFHGLLHIAVGFYHLTQKNNIKGSILQFTKAVKKLGDYEENYCGINLGELIKRVNTINKNLAKKKLPARMPKIVLL